MNQERQEPQREVIRAFQWWSLGWAFTLARMPGTSYASIHPGALPRKGPPWHLGRAENRRSCEKHWRKLCKKEPALQVGQRKQKGRRELRGRELERLNSSLKLCIILVFNVMHLCTHPHASVSICFQNPVSALAKHRRQTVSSTQGFEISSYCMTVPEAHSSLHVCTPTS